MSLCFNMKRGNKGRGKRNLLIIISIIIVLVVLSAIYIVVNSDSKFARLITGRAVDLPIAKGFILLDADSGAMIRQLQEKGEVIDLLDI